MSHVPWRHVCGLGVLGILALVFARDLASSAAGQGPAPSAADFGQWTNLGPSHLLPNDWAGRVAAIAVDPANPNHWLAGAALGGVWETYDAGATWTPRTDGQPSLAMGAITFSPSAPNVVYAGTGEAFAGWGHAGGGMLRSDDSGATWYLINAATFARASVRTIIVDPANPDVVVAGTSRGVAGRDLTRVASPPVFGVQRSVDGGRRWTRVLTGQVSSLASDPATFTRQYAAIGDPVAAPNTNPTGDVQPGTMPNGLYRSTDAGLTWKPISGPWVSNDPAVYGSGYIDLAIAPSNPDVMYASVQVGARAGNVGLRGLFRTNNAWAETPEWTQVPMAGVTSTKGGETFAGYCASECSYMNVISVDPGSADTVFAAGVNVWRCRNCSTNPSWQKMTATGPNNMVHGDHHGLVWAGNRLITINDGGVNSSIDRGETWKAHNAGLANLQLYSGAVHPTRSDLIVANTQDSLLITGSTWGPWTNVAASRTFAEGQVVMSSRRPDTDWMVTYLYSVVGRTTDGGRSFQQVQGGIDYRAPYTNLPFQPTLRKCPDNDDVVFVGANRLWRTNNFFSAAAPAWSVNAPDFDVSSCTAPGRPQASCVVIHSIAFTGSDSGTCTAYAYGTGGGFMRITSNGGASWSDFDPADGVPNRAVTAIAFAKGSPNIAYVALSGFDEDAQRPPARPGHVFRTTNALSPSPTWTNVTPRSANVPFNTIAIDPATPTTVYAGADNGVWASRDGGTTWAYMGPESGLPNAAVFDLQIQASTGKLFAFTFGRGAFVLAPPVGAARTGAASP